ncbi:hypothetical protein [Flavobacterium sp. FlaQc-50]|uniref:hypothetical protein n=1 Tax=unclassified Flavobacterium TaxID=196869 RepID=UPI0037573662
MKKFAFLLALGTLLLSCSSDEDTIPAESYQKSITSFKVINTPEQITAVVSEVDKKIVLTLPYYLGATAIELDIQLATGYTLVDRPENKLIQDVSDYLLNKKEALVYTLKNEKGELKKYALEIVTYQPDIVVKELYNEGAKAKEYPRTATLDWGEGPTVIENSIRIASDQIIKRVNGIEITKVFFIDATGKETELKKISTSKTGINAYFPENMAVGEYQVRVENYSRSVLLKRPVKLIKMQGEK